MASLFRDPSGEKIFSNISPQEQVKVTGRSSGGTNTDDSERHGASTTTEHWFNSVYNNYYINMQFVYGTNSSAKFKLGHTEA